jgi:hypothetical protein
MNFARTLVLIVPATCGVTGCCSEDPPTPPELESITQWQHSGGNGGDPSCAGALEFEPNESVAASNVLGANEKCERRDFSAKVAGDADAFYVWGEPCESGTPELTVTSGPDDLRVCLFVACSVGRTGFDSDPCPGAASYRTSEGLLGCCATKPGTLRVGINCDSQFVTLGHVPDYDAYVVVDRGSSQECAEYSISVRL